MKLRINHPYFHQKTLTHFMVESEPCLRTIKTTTGKKFPLMLPYVQHWVQLHKLQNYYNCYGMNVTCTTEPFEKGSVLYPIPLPQVYLNGGFCFGTFQNNYNTNRNEVVRNVIDFFWNSSFADPGTKKEWVYLAPKIFPYVGDLNLKKWQKKYFKEKSWQILNPDFMPATFKLYNKEFQ